MRAFGMLLAGGVLFGADDAIGSDCEDNLPWPAPASPPLEPDYTVPYLPPVEPVLCPSGDIECFHEFKRDVRDRTRALDCDHDAVFSDAYLFITRWLIDASESGAFEHADRLNHEAVSYGREYLRQYDLWHYGDQNQVSPAWQVAFEAAEQETQTALGDLLLQLNAHIRRDNPIRAIEQTKGVLRRQGDMPEASGRPDHNEVSDQLADALKPMLKRLAKRYEPSIDDGAQLFCQFIDAEGLYTLISTWREESWRNAEQLRHARAEGGVEGEAYQAKLADIEAAALAGAQFIRSATLATPQQQAERDAYCESQPHAQK